jgi:hypothetical protein
MALPLQPLKFAVYSTPTLFSPVLPMPSPSDPCPKCGSHDLLHAEPFKRHFSIWAWLLGGFLLSLLWSASSSKAMRCQSCDHVFRLSSDITQIARILLVGLIILMLLNVLAQYYGWAE